MTAFDIPILLVIYKRDDTFKQVIDSLRVGKPKKFYCISDGPKSKHDEAQVLKTRQVLSQIDWPCQVFTKFASVNQGLKNTIENGLDWVLSNEKYVVLIEDDIVVSPSFFPYMSHTLKKYLYIRQIAGVAGYNPIKTDDNASYHFSHFHRSWGWGVYKRSWEHGNQLSPVKVLNNPLLTLYFTIIARITRLGKLDTWDYQWTLTNLSKKRLFVVPNRNLVKNIGVGEGATHTGKIPRSLLAPIENLDFPLQDPSQIKANNKEDEKFAKIVYLNHRSILGALKVLLWG